MARDAITLGDVAIFNAPGAGLSLLIRSALGRHAPGIRFRGSSSGGSGFQLLSEIQQPLSILSIDNLSGEQANMECTRPELGGSFVAARR
jgi:hypothetical protein